MREVAGKGLGVVATRDFLPGEVVMVEEPLLVTRDGEQVGTCTSPTSPTLPTSRCRK